MSKHWKVALVLGTLALLGTAGWGSREYFWGQQNGAKYRLAAVEQGEISAYVSATGTLRSLFPALPFMPSVFTMSSATVMVCEGN